MDIEEIKKFVERQNTDLRIAINGEQGATKMNQLMGHEFAQAVMSIQTCCECGVECPHEVDYRMLDFDNAIHTFKCTNCGEVWEYLEDEDD